MSTTIVEKILRRVASASATLVGMVQPEIVSLSEVVKKLRSEKGLSTTDIERATKGDIKDATVTKIENNNVEPKNIRAGTLAALGRGLDVPPAYLFEIACGIYRGHTILDEQLRLYISVLSESRKKDLLNIARALSVGEEGSIKPVAEDEEFVFYDFERDAPLVEIENEKGKKKAG